MKTLALKRFQIINLIIFSLIIVYFNYSIDFNYGDDVWAKSQVLNLDGIIGLYMGWSGRVVAYIFQIFMIHNPAIFRILNSIIMIATPIAAWMLLDKDKKLGSLTLVILLFLLYHYGEMREAGLITTYVTYYWTLFANILFYLAIRSYLKAEKFLSFSLVIVLFTGVIACNTEIGAFVNGIILFIILFVNYSKYKTVNSKIVLLMLIPVLFLLFFLICPGLHIRTASETITWLPEFSSFTIVHKLYLGFAETLLYYFNSKSIILMIFLGSLLVSVIKNDLPISYIFLSLFGLIGFIIARNPDKLIINFASVSNEKAYLFLTFLLCFCSFVFLVISRLYEKNKQILLLVSFILILGLLTRILMGFSPTLYASGFRTFMYCDFALLGAIYYILKYSKTNLDELSPIFLTFFAYPYCIGNLFF